MVRRPAFGCQPARRAAPASGGLCRRPPRARNAPSPRQGLRNRRRFLPLRAALSSHVWLISRRRRADRLRARDRAQSEVEETLKRISSHKGVHGILIVNVEGVPIRSTLDPALVRTAGHRPPRWNRLALFCRPGPGLDSRAGSRGKVAPPPVAWNRGMLTVRRLLVPQTTSYASHITAIAAKARSVIRDLDPTNDLTFLRLRSKKHEIMVAPGTLSSPPAPFALRARLAGPRATRWLR